MSDQILIEQKDGGGKPVSVSKAHWGRWPQLSETFRPVAEKKATPVAVTPPTGDNDKEK